MSFLNHPTSDIEDAFFFTFPDYISASPDYVPASSRNTSSESSNNSYGLVLIASPTLSLFHDDPYMKVMHAYDTIIPPQVPIPPPTIMPPSPMLSRIFKNSFFPRKYCHQRNEAVNDHLPLLLPYLKHLRWEKVIIRQVWNVTRNKMAPKRTSTSAAPAMTQAAIRQLVADSIAAALEAQAANMANTDNTNRNHKPRENLAARKCTYKEFMSCQPFYFNGTERAVGLIRWFEQNESVFSRSNCTDDYKVIFATGTLTKDALSWWNFYAKTIGIEQADKIALTELKRLLTNKYCPRTEVKKLEDEFYNLVVNENDLNTYARRFQELTTLCPNMMPNNEKLMEVFIGGLPQSIEGTVTASKPQTLEEAINIA
nr:reverse transcriptase domain-containing protein [Tanacetum cinerariifolium]